MCDMKNEKAVRSGAVFGYFNSHCETVRNSSDAAFLIPADGYLQSEDEAGGAVNNKTPSSCIHPVLTALIQYTMTELPDGSIFHLKMTELLRQLVPSFCLCRVKTDHQQTGECVEKQRVQMIPHRTPVNDVSRVLWPSQI